uniref:Uncharacterized protein n=1 Tax=Glossina brevipalpis TaxID=37001 RepID=A0A1A9WV66_9MUSC
MLQNSERLYLIFGMFFISKSNLFCLHDLLRAAPELLTHSLLCLLEPLNNSLKDVAEVMH